MKKSFGTMEVQLTKSLVSISRNGSLVKAQSVSPNDAINEFLEICAKVESYVLKNA